MQTVLLTLEDVTQWRDELRRLTMQAQEINRRAAELQKKIADAQPWVAAVAAANIQASHGERVQQATMPFAPTIERATDRPTVQPNSMFEAVVTLLKKTPKALEPKEIAKAIKEDESLGEKIRNSHPNYLYTALMRMVKRGLIVRDSQGRYSVPKTNEAA